MTLKIAYPPQPCSALWATLTLTLHLKGAEIETWTLARNWKFESISLQRRVASELGFCKAGPRAMLHELATAKARIAALEENSRELISRLEAITARATSAARTRVRAVEIAAELGRKLQMQSQSSRGRL